MSVTIAGDLTVERMQAFAKALRQVGDKQLIPALRRSFNEDTKSARLRVRSRLRMMLPKRGGLNTWMGRTPILSSQVQPRRVSVTLSLGYKGHDFVRINDTGAVRHPLFGNRKRWFTTRLDAPSFWEDALEPEIPLMQQHVSAALDAAIQKALDTYGG